MCTCADPRSLVRFLWGSTSWVKVSSFTFWASFLGVKYLLDTFNMEKSSRSPTIALGWILSLLMALVNNAAMSGIMSSCFWKSLSPSPVIDTPCFRWQICLLAGLSVGWVMWDAMRLLNYLPNMFLERWHVLFADYALNWGNYLFNPIGAIVSHQTPQSQLSTICGLESSHP